MDLTRPARLVDLAALLSTPLLPQAYLGLIHPLRQPGRARVEQVLPEAGGAATLVLRPGSDWAGHAAGQWIRLGVEVDGVLHYRSYSLTGPPRADATITVTVKAMDAGFISQHLVHRLVPGTVLRIDPAEGTFVLPTVLTRPLLFVTAGSGITPVMGMLRTLAQRGALPDVVLVHSALTPEDVIFGTELRSLAAAHPSLVLVERHTDTAGLLTVDDLIDVVPDWAERESFACGPAGLLDALEAHWQAAGVPLRTERFAATTFSGAAGEGGPVTFVRSATVVQADGSTSLLDIGEANGLLMPSGCRMGICFTCVLPLVSGQVRDLRTGNVHGEQGDLIQTCVSAAAGACHLDL